MLRYLLPKQYVFKSLNTDEPPDLYRVQLFSKRKENNFTVVESYCLIATLAGIVVLFTLLIMALIDGSVMHFVPTTVQWLCVAVEWVLCFLFGYKLFHKILFNEIDYDDPNDPRFQKVVKPDSMSFDEWDEFSYTLYDATKPDKRGNYWLGYVSTRKLKKILE